MRNLDDREREVIAHILSVEFDGVAQLRSQLGYATAQDSWGPKGSPSFDIDVPVDCEPSSFAENLVPVTAEVTDVDGSYEGELLLWVTDGKISALEYAWVTDNMPGKLPDISAITLSATRADDSTQTFPPAIDPEERSLEYRMTLMLMRFM